MKRSPALLRFSAVMLTLTLWTGLSARDTAALPRRDPETGGEPERPPCQARAYIDAHVGHTGLPLIGANQTVSALNAKIIVTELDPDGFNGECTTTVHPVPAGSYSWQFLKPPGSNAQLSGASTLSVKFVPDVVGTYELILTIACPGGCQVSLLTGGTIGAGAISRSIKIQAVDHIERPPELQPFMPALSSTAPTPQRDGLTDGGVTDPQWVTVNEWNGPGSYELLEGWVYDSHIARTDNPLNHDSQDHNDIVRPDPPYNRLLKPGQLEMEVEWERSHFPEFFRSTRGDRISTVGYWIYDCGHQFRTEIHPPVMMAVHRARAIPLPGSFGYGTNIYIPGIVTDIWVNRQAGEITRNCSDTGLHQPPILAKLPTGQTLWVNGPCLPDAAGYEGGNPINRIYEFNIYLPRSPYVTATQAGMKVPEVPLYFENTDRAGVVEDPVITVQPAGDATYLHVRIDLSDYSGQTYSRRIVAGWAYPSPDNWGLKNWRIQIHSIDVDDDGDPIGSGDGDWRFWVNINNGDQEWTKIYDCDGCVHGFDDFDGASWGTGFPGFTHSLGPDLLLFPGESIWFHSSGFEDDSAWSDFTGRVSQLHPQEARSYSIDSECESDYPSGCCEYTINYEIREGPAVGNANLTPAGSALYEAYVLRPGELGNRPERPNLTDLVNELPPLVQKNWNLPVDLIMEPGQPPVMMEELEFFEDKMPEPNAFSGITKERLTALLEPRFSSRADAAKVTNLMNDLAGEMDFFLKTKPREDVQEFIDVCRDVLPKDLWDTFLKPVIAAAPTVTPAPTSTPEPEPTPTLTPTPTNTPTNTPIPIPTETPIPDPNRRVVEIFDNAGDTSGDLTGKTDFDDLNNRNLSIHCNASTANAVNWHVYVRKGFGGYQYLGQTGSGTITTLNWYAGQLNIAPEFRTGPDINAVYSFRVVRLDDKLSPDDFFPAQAPVGLNITDGSSQTILLPENPNLEENDVVIYDDLLGGRNLAPVGGSGTDRDRADWRALQTAWNFGDDPSTVNDYHVYVSIDGGAYQYLGQTGSGAINYFWWSPVVQYKMNPQYRGGPEGGHTYQFTIYQLPVDGDGSVRSLTSGVVNLSVEE
ncbi:MAG: hypothetical protein ACE15F_18715 [bacterium]